MLNPAQGRAQDCSWATTCSTVLKPLLKWHLEQYDAQYKFRLSKTFKCSIIILSTYICLRLSTSKTLEHTSLRNVNSVEIRCHGDNSCIYSDYIVDQVESLYIHGNESRSCDWIDWDLMNINNATFICENGACDRQRFDIENANYIEISCDKLNEYIYPSSCY